MAEPTTNTPAAPAASPAPAARDRFIRHANLMSVLTVFSRLFGLVRDKVCAVYIQQNSTEWSAFWMGFQLPNLTRRIFGEGALTAIFVPTYTKILKAHGEHDANRLAGVTASLLVTVLLGLTAIGEAIVLPFALSSTVTADNRLAAAMIAIQLPYCVLVCLVALFGAIATVHERFTAQALSPVILNIAMALAVIIPVLILGWHGTVRTRIFYLAGAVLLAGCLQILLMLPTLRRCGVRLRAGLSLATPGVRDIIVAMLPMILGLSAVQLNTYMDTQIAWWLSADGHNGHTVMHLFGHAVQLPMAAGAVGVLSVAQRLYMLPVGIFGVAMATAILPPMSAAAAKKDTAELKRLLAAGLKKTLFLSIPMAAGMVLIARPLITVLYTHGVVARAAWAATFFCVGIWAFEALMVILRAFYALSDTITPMKVAVGMIALNFGLNLTLVWFLQEGGIALSTTISAILQCAVLLFILRRRLGLLGLKGLGRMLLQSLFCCLVMLAGSGAVLWALAHLTLPIGEDHWRHLAEALLRLALTVAVAAACYLGTARLLGMPELADVPLVGRYLRNSNRKTQNAKP